MPTRRFPEPSSETRECRAEKIERKDLVTYASSSEFVGQTFPWRQRPSLMPPTEIRAWVNLAASRSTIQFEVISLHFILYDRVLQELLYLTLRLFRSLPMMRPPMMRPADQNAMVAASCSPSTLLCSTTVARARLKSSTRVRAVDPKAPFSRARYWRNQCRVQCFWLCASGGQQWVSRAAVHHSSLLGGEGCAPIVPN